MLLIQRSLQCRVVLIQRNSCIIYNTNNNNRFHHYPDGNGPDAELIKALEKDLVDMNPNVTFEDIAELDEAKEVL